MKRKSMHCLISFLSIFIILGLGISTYTAAADEVIIFSNYQDIYSPDSLTSALMESFISESTTCISLEDNSPQQIGENVWSFSINLGLYPIGLSFANAALVQFNVGRRELIR